MSHLTDEMRGFCRLVRAATAANPFMPERDRLNREIGGPGPGDPFERVEARVGEAVGRLRADGEADIRRFVGGDRELVRVLLLFQVFHEQRAAIDDHIDRQAAAGGRALPAPFAPPCLERLENVGFGPAERAVTLAQFFQLRRAFRFIDQGLVGRSPAMQRLRADLWTTLFTHDFLGYEKRLWNRMEDFSVLLLGETGSGKGAAAAAVSRAGYIPFDAPAGRFAESFTELFVPVTLSQFAESLIESELFGHRKGAFTGAVSDHEGVFGRCRPNGAIFLDEIGELSAPVQIKLLRVLQERVFSPVGSHEARRFSGRVVAATNRPLDALRRSGRFREDFYYRLCSDEIVVPPLRRRLGEAPDEMDDLLRVILRRLCGPAGMELIGEIRAALDRAPGPAYAWPGNVRELEQAVRRILLRGAYRPPEARAPEHEAGGLASALARDVEAGSLDARTLIARYCRMLYERDGRFAEVARRTGLDRRTARRHVVAHPPPGAA